MAPRVTIKEEKATTTTTTTNTNSIPNHDPNNNNDPNNHNGNNNNNNNNSNLIQVLEGPDLNASRSPFDKKVYRQILLPNGLRAVLISDTVAMTQSYNAGLGQYDDDDEDDDEDDDKDDNHEEKEGEKKRRHDKDSDSDNDDNNDDDDDEDDDDEEDDADDDDSSSGQHGLRDAAAAMVVGVGSYYDPPECQGMAHFLEHLLFMGSEKYPEENAYDQFMSSHGGSDNAFTELEHTVYHFDIPQEYLSKALDMFAQFFTSPLLLENSVERELQSIESEFQLVKNSDNCRVQQLMSYTCGHTPEEHPFAKFSWGNIQSLQEIPKAKNVNPLEKLREFYDQYYYASNMRLVVIGGYSLDFLQEQVVQSFSGIRSYSDTKKKNDDMHIGSSNNNGITNGSLAEQSTTTTTIQPAVYTWENTSHFESPLKSVGMPFRNVFGRIYHFAPVKDRHSISITWQLPCQFGNWKSKPCDYLAHLIGHEAKGSILASLKAKSWAIACCAGVGSEGYENCSSHALFTVSISLSEEGVANWPQVVSEVYQYVGMLRYHCQKGLPMWIYEELRSIQEVAHRYCDEESPEDLVELIAEEMAPANNLPPERLLDGTALLFEYTPELIQEIVDKYFNPYNARLDMASTSYGRSADYDSVEPTAEEVIIPTSPDGKIFDANQAGAPQQEPIFGTYYWCEQLPESRMKEWSDMAQPQLPPEGSLLSLPQQNPFIPTNFSLKSLPPADCDHPLLNCSIKLQITVGKRKQWFPATVTRYNSIKNQLLLSYEDEDEKWHKVDVTPNELTTPILTSPDFEGTLDNKKIKYRIVALAEDGEGAVRRFGDESDYDVEDGIGFPPVPPARSTSRLPKLICNTSILRLWHLQDRTFKRPIAELRLQLNCAEANKTALHGACADLMVHLVTDSLTETAYMASVCEIGSSFSSCDVGFTLRVHGFDDKLLKLFLVLLERIMDFRGRKEMTLPDSIKNGRFDLCLETYKRACVNGGIKSSKLSTNARVRCLRPTIWSSNQKLKAIENLDIPTFMTTIGSVLDKIGVQGIYHGNVDSSDASFAQREIISIFQSRGGGGLPRKKYPHPAVMRMPASNYTVCLPSKDPAEPNTAVEVYFQVAQDNHKDRVMVDLLMEMMYEPLYDQIRTKDQFGYHVSCDSRWTDGVIGMHIQVVTSSKTAKEADDRIEQFLLDFRETLKDMTEEDFFKHLVGLAKQKLDMFHSLSDETGHYWSEIRDGRYLWEVEREEVICLKSVTKKQALAAYEKWLWPKSKKRCRMAVHVICSEGPASEGRPNVDQDNIGNYIDDRIKEFHKYCKNQKFGRIY